MCIVRDAISPRCLSREAVCQIVVFASIRMLRFLITFLIRIDVIYGSFHSCGFRLWCTFFLFDDLSSFIFDLQLWW